MSSSLDSFNMYAQQAKNFMGGASLKDLRERVYDPANSIYLYAVVIPSLLFLVLSPGLLLTLPAVGDCDKKVPFPLNAAGTCTDAGVYTPVTSFPTSMEGTTAAAGVVGSDLVITTSATATTGVKVGMTVATTTAALRGIVISKTAGTGNAGTITIRVTVPAAAAISSPDDLTFSDAQTPTIMKNVCEQQKKCKKVWMSGYTSVPAIFVHTVVFLVLVVAVSMYMKKNE